MQKENLHYLNEWIYELRYKTEGGWYARLKPNRIIETLRFDLMVEIIELHVINEIIMLCADAFNLMPDNMRTARKKLQIGDARLATTYIIDKRLPQTKNRLIAAQMGYQSACSIHYANLQRIIQHVVYVSYSCEKCSASYMSNCVDMSSGVHSVLH